MTDAGAAALRRLLADAGDGGQAKLDALTALSQRTVFVPTWGTGGEYRVIASSNGVSALPVYLDVAALTEGAHRFGWAQPDGSVPHKEVGARGALGHALAQNLLVIVEFGLPHALDVEPAEIKPLLAPPSRRDSSFGPVRSGTPRPGTLGAVRSPSSSGMAAVQPGAGSVGDAAAGPLPVGRFTPPPGTLTAAQPTPAPGTLGAQRPDAISVPIAYGGQVASSSEPRRPSAVFKAPSGGVATATFGGGQSVGGVTIAPLSSTPSDILLRALAETLRGFPEVEFALVASVARGAASAVPTVMVRVDTSFRTRVAQIVSALRQAGTTEGATLDVLLLDDKELMRVARAVGLPFYPWKR